MTSPEQTAAQPAVRAMAGGDIAIIGLPSPGRRRLTDGLGIRHLKEDVEIPRPGPDAEASHERTPQRIASSWAGYFANGSTSRALLVYRTPWDFLEDELREAAITLPAESGCESFCAAALGFWRAYHLALLGLRREHAAQIVMLNGDRPIDVNGVASLVEARFGWPPGWSTADAGDGPGAAADRHEIVYREAVDVLAPECLKLYATMEACAELMGRAPEFEFGGLARREHLSSDVLALVERLATASARTDFLKSENAIYLLQIEQIQQELERQFGRNREQGGRLAELQRRLAELQRRLAELQQRLEFESVPLRRKLSRGAAAIRASFAHSPFGLLRLVHRRERELWRQALDIRLSGLFDEAWYLRAYPDVAQAGLDPIEHYLRYGVSEARNPSARFDSQWYMTAYPDVAEAGMNPLVHYVKFGRSENRRPVRSIA